MLVTSNIVTAPMIITNTNAKIPVKAVKIRGRHVFILDIIAFCCVEADIIYAPFDLPPQWFLAYCYCFFYLWVIVPGECLWIVTAALPTTNCAHSQKLLPLCAIMFRTITIIEARSVWYGILCSLSFRQPETAS